MSCWHRTEVLRIPASALGFQYLREWTEFLRKHEDDFEWYDGSGAAYLYSPYDGDA